MSLRFDSTTYGYDHTNQRAWQKVGTTTTTTYTHTDHLNSTNVVTDSIGATIQILDYYPYGAARVNTKTGSFDNKKKYIGIERDDTGLDYALNRYYANKRGQVPYNGRIPIFHFLERLTL